MLAPARLRKTDWLVLALVVVVQAIAPRSGSEMRGADPAWVGAAALLTALGQAGALLWRRDAPLRSAVAVMILYAVSVVTVGAVPPLAPWVAIWALATKLPGWRAAIRAAGLAAATTVGLLLVNEVGSGGTGAEIVLSGVTVVVCLSAVLVRSERGRLDAVRRATAEERLRIARDMHDVVGHGLSVVAIQSSTARLALARDDKPDRADRAGRRGVEQPQRDARDAAAARRPDGERFGGHDGVDDRPCPGACTRFRRSSTTSRPVASPSPGRSTSTRPPSRRHVQLCAYRIAQEALTNALKHSPGASIAVTSAADSRPRTEFRACVCASRHDGAEYAGFVETGVDPDSWAWALAASRLEPPASAAPQHTAATESGWLVDARCRSRSE